METTLQDIRFGLRMLRNSPAFTTVAVLTLALGIGANTAIFTLINAVMLRMLPVRNVKELVVVGDPTAAHSRSHGTPRTDLYSYRLYQEFRDRNSVFQEMLAASEMHRTQISKPTGQAISDDVLGVLVTGNYFSVLGVNPFAGRTLYEGDDKVRGGHPVAVISFALWKDKFNADRSVVGDSIRVNGYPFTIVGVMPPGFNGQVVGDVQQVWVPMAMQEQVMVGRKWLDDPEWSWLTIMARLKPSVSIDQAKANLNLILKQLLDSDYGAQVGEDNKKEMIKHPIDVVRGDKGLSTLRGAFAKPLYLLMGIVGLILLISCVNVANLLLARATSRQKEIAVRLAMGAAPSRIMRQMLTESVLLSLLGGFFGLLFAFWGTRLLLSVARMNIEQSGLHIQPDWRILLFNISVCVATGILFGFVPAIRALHVELNATLKNAAPGAVGGTARGIHIGKVLVAGQVALSLLVLFAAGLLIRSLQNLRNVDVGYNRDKVLTVRVDPLAAGYDTAEKGIALERELRERLQQVPGIMDVSSSEMGLFSGSACATGIAFPGRETPTTGDDNLSYCDNVGPNYFRMLKIPVLLGRDISEADTNATQKVTVVNEKFAKQFFPNQNPIGQRFWWDDQEHRGKPLEIVGVVGNVIDKELKDPVVVQHYLPAAQKAGPFGMLNIALRTAGDPAAMTDAVRNAIKGFNPGLTINNVRTLSSQMDNTISNEIIIAKLSSFFGVLALLLASIGLYGVMSYTIAARARELGVRIALGAQRSNVLRMVMKESMLLVVIGIGIGVPSALVASRIIVSMLYGTKAYDPAALVAVVLLLTVVGALAGFIPARRATKVDPMVALRYE
jgi:predicted permease